MSPETKKYAVSKKLHAYATRKVPHIFWDVASKKYTFVQTTGTRMHQKDKFARLYVRMLNLTKQAHPVK